MYAAWRGGGWPVIRFPFYPVHSILGLEIGGTTRPKIFEILGRSPEILGQITLEIFDAKILPRKITVSGSIKCSLPASYNGPHGLFYAKSEKLSLSEEAKKKKHLKAKKTLWYLCD